MEKKKYKVVHDRDTCIGCSACASVTPEYWEMDSDGKSNLKGSSNTGNGQEQILGSNEEPLTEDFEKNMDAAESCPVECIHVYTIDEDGEENKEI